MFNFEQVIIFDEEGKLMQKMLKNRRILLIVWIVIAILFAANQPNLKQIINQKGEATIPKNEPSEIASQMIDKMGTSKGDSLLLVFNDNKKISDNEMKDIENGINKLNKNKDKLKITKIIDPFGMPEAKDQLISKDNTTLITEVFFEKGTRDSSTVISDFRNAVKDIKVKHYITGSLAISNDYVSDVAKGVDKSSVLTIGFILVVLILMFRSVVTPVVSLLSVGISYICSMGIIGILVNRFNFPVTSFTQMFVILVLFGIGTDYHILLFNRFKEELSKGSSVEEAVIKSYKTAGKTILYSGLTVFMGFASLTFVKFPVYRSANAVAIGIAVLLIEIMTLTPLIMRILGEKLFWPSKSSSGHKENRFWGKLSSVSVNHPVISLIVVAAMLAPIIIFNTPKLSFDSIKDLSVNDPSVKGFNIVSDKFGSGKVMQTTIVIKDKKSMGNNECLEIIDDLTEKLKGMNGIKEVSGPTQPKGSVIEDLYTDSQTGKVASGLSDADSGVKKVQNGIDTMNNSMSSPDFSPVQNLINGTGSLQNGMDAVTSGLEKINTGIDQGADGADSLASGTAQLKTGVSSINAALSTISGKITDINNGYNTLGQGYKSLPSYVGQLRQLASMMQASIIRINAKLPNDPDAIALKVMVGKLEGSLDSLTTAINTANGNYDILTSGLSQVNAGLKKVIDSTGPQSDLVVGINNLENGENALSEGLKRGSAGESQVIQSMAQLRNGADKVKSGEVSLYSGLNSLGSGVTQLKGGMNKSSGGLNSISNGIDKSSSFLTQLTNTKNFYIPKEELNNPDIKEMLDMYMSPDRKTAKLTVTFNSEPYSDSSINHIKDINTFVKNELKGTKLSDAEIGIAGATSNSYDLKNIATHDITFTQIIVLSAIFILLILVIKSFWIPVYIIGALITAYYTSLSATSFISKILFKSAKEGLSWNVPFFAFVMIAALGVDYSIFLMRRFREYPELSGKDAIDVAAKNIGGVIMSAALILTGTFATMYPSNIIVLMELAICVDIGLFLLGFILLPAAIPALMSLEERISKNK